MWQDEHHRCESRSPLSASAARAEVAPKAVASMIEQLIRRRGDFCFI
jgi:hypothetical protein